MALPEMTRAESLLLMLWESRGTDLLLTAGAPPLLRIGGELVPVSKQEPLSALDTEELLDEVLGAAGREGDFEGCHELDFAFTWQNHARVRGNAYHQRGSVALALRMIPYEIPTMDELRVPLAMRRTTELRRGLVLVTGPTGGGKSTLLASLIDHINSTRRCHIITIEDPIEYLHRHKLAAVDQREVGDDTADFPSALRSALREDPDVLLVGEMRDQESIRFALTIAETGHLVFATLHTNDVAQTLDRIVDEFPAEHQSQVRVQLASTLTAICYQRLLPRVGGGLVAAHEVLVATSAIRNLIREGKANQLRNNLVTGQQDGMQTLEMSLNELILAGLVDPEEALAVSLYPKEVLHPVAEVPSPEPTARAAAS